MTPLNPDHQPAAVASSTGASPCAVCARCCRPLITTNLAGDCLPCLLADGLGEEPSGRPAPDPDRFGHFEISREADGAPAELGHGAMGTTYRAWDTVLARAVALKVIDAAAVAAHPAAGTRFLREARAAAGLRHPNVAEVFHYGVREEDGQPFYAMELVEGETLEARVRREGPLPVEPALAIAAEVTLALVAAEARGLVHRDLKPANLMVSATGEDGAIPGELRVKVIDFGLAKSVLGAAGTGGASLTVSGFVGTPAFASPEQFKADAADLGTDGDARVDARSDLYSLGVTLWYLLTGKVPFAGRTLEEIYQRQVHASLPVEQLATAAVPAPVVTLLRALLAPDPADRPQSARELAGALRDCRQALAATPPPAVIPRPRRVTPRLAAVSALAALFLVVILAALGGYYRHARGPVASAPGGRITTAVPEKSVAVLPFANLSADPANDALAAGVQEEVLTQLTKIGDLKVIARGSAEQFRPGDAAGRGNLRPVGEALGVAHAVEGSVQRLGGRVRVHVRLVATADSTQEWAETFDRPVADLFALQREIARAVATRLQARLSPGERAADANPGEPLTADPAAYELFLRARRAMNTETGDSPEMFARIVALLEAAVARDPNFARAYTELTRWHALTHLHGYDRTPARAERARAAAEGAARVRPGSAEAHLAQGLYRYYLLRDYAAAHDSAAAALAAVPNSAEALFLLGLAERRQGHWAPALEHFRRSAALDPFNTDTVNKLIETLLGLRRYAEVRAEAARWTPGDPRAMTVLVVVPASRFQETGDVAALREGIANYPPGSDDAEGIAALERFRLALLERDAPAAERALAPSAATRFRMEAFGQFWPRALVQADLAALSGDDPAATVHPALLAVRPALLAAVEANPEDAAAHMTLSRLDARLGRREDALAAARRALDLTGPARDGYEGPMLERQFAAILAILGERDAAVDCLREAATHPSGPTYGDLRRNPEWDSLRGHPGFEALLRSLAPGGREPAA